MKYLKLAFTISLVVFFSGCAHVISNDYDHYLMNNEGGYKLQYTNLVAEYVLTPNTVNHNYEFRAATAGYAHLWIVNFGKMLEQTLESKDVQSAFNKLSKANGNSSPGVLAIKFNLLDYKFEGFEARVRLQITASKDSSILFDQTYYETGISQGGKLFLAGTFGMKNAIQQSTKSAIDRILSRSLNDMASIIIK
ncbi:MAG: hypothetical protein A2Y48_03345 [Nitrospirae bacterium RIFCSPLOW2_12_42_9]|nr:MAG: hypothetical protein A2Y48_03345 [Nitrospirae bacterium RIFCSPLOW2_12_42_9]HBI25129.1 hypothetical protein [Nitrospiraceae bacterium]